MGEGTKKFATSVLRFAVVWLGLACQRLTQGAEIAMPPQLAVQSGGNGQTFASPILLSQAQPISTSITPVESGSSMADSSTEPQSSTQETISITLPRSSQNRRRPRMAGIPEGMRPVEVPPEGSSVTQQAGTEGGQTTTAETTAGTATLQGAGTQANTVEAQAGTPNDEEGFSPGARAKSRVDAQINDRKYEMAPIAWQGLLFDTLAWRRSRNWGQSNYTSLTGQVKRPALTPDGFMNLKGALIRAQTFALHPWVANFSGRLGVISDDLRLSSTDYQSNQQNRRFIYGGKANIFPVSRFPFKLSYDVNDTRVDNQQADITGNTDSVSRSLALEQRYRPLKGPALYDFGYNSTSSTLQSYSMNSSSLLSYQPGTTFRYDNLHGNLRTRLGENLDQPFMLYGSHETTSESDIPGSEVIRDNITANHLWIPDEYLLTLRTNANYFQSRASGSTSRNLQIGSEGTWQPEDIDNPLVVRAGANAFKLQNIVGNSTNNTQVLSTKVNATYYKWTNLYLSGGGTMSDSSVNGRSNLATTQYGRALYRPAATVLGNGLRYGKSASTGFNNFTSTSGGSDFSTSTTVTHHLSSGGQAARHQVAGSRLNLVYHGEQSLTVRTDELKGSSQTLINSGSVTWIPYGLRNRLPSTRLSGKEIKAGSSGSTNLISSLGLHATDSRTYGRYPSHSQSFSLSIGAGAGGGYTGNASGYGATADASIEYSRNTSGGESGALTGNAAWGHRFIYGYSYRQGKVFDVSGLNYALRFSANVDPELKSRRYESFQTMQQYATNSKIVAYGFALDQYLAYRIGQNEALLVASINDSYGVNTSSLFLRFRAWRNFGN